MKGSDGHLYKLLEIEIKGIAQYGNDKVDYYSFIGDVPPAGVTLKTIAVREVSSDGVKYSDLGAGPKEAGPVFGAGDVTGSSMEIADNAPGENTTTHTATGVIAFTDNVGDSHTVDVVPDALDYRGTLTAIVTDETDVDASGQVDWQFSVEDSALDDLAEGESVVQTYDIVLEDSGGGTDVKTVTITLTGKNDVPVFAEVVEFQQGFETNSDGILDGSNGWYGDVTVVPTGTNGIASPDGSSHAILTQDGPVGDETGPFTRFDGFRADFNGDWTAEVKVYLDTGWAAGEGFDYSVASSGSDGAHQRDFIFHVTKDTSTGELLVGGSNNTNFDPREDLETINHYTVPASGWYTLQHVFHNDGGVLSVDLNLVDAGGTIVWTETRTDVTNDTIDQIGGNRYGWFTNIDVAGGIAVDSYSLDVPDYQAPQVMETLGTPAPADELTASGDVPFGDVDLIDTHTASAAFSSASLSNGDAVDAGLLTELGSAMSAMVSDDSTGDQTGQVSWTFTLDADLAEFLAAGEVLRATYDVTVTDNQSTSDTVQVEVTIVGTNDAPVVEGASVTTGSVSEPGDIPGIDEAGLGGGLEPTIALNATITTALDTLPTTPGDLSSVLATVETELGDTAQAIAVVWDYLDDAYVSAGPNQTNINEAFVRLGVEYVEYLQAGGSPLVDVTAKFTPDGPDADTLPERDQSLHDNLLGNLSQGVLNGRFSGTTLTDLTALVSGADPDLLTRTYYDGQDSHPAQEADARQFDLDNGFVPSAEGTLVASDVDSGAVLTWSVDTNAGTYGTLEFDTGTGAWKYTLDNAAADSLADGESFVENFMATVEDEHGATDMVALAITVNGTNDAPVIQSASTVSGAVAPESLAGITEAGPGGPLEPDAALLTPTVNTALAMILTDPDQLNAILATVQSEVGDMATAFAVVWDYIDDNYSYYNNAINEAAVRLGVAYADYLQNGGTPLFNITAKFTPDGGDAGSDPDRMQSLHDNILGNLDIPSMIDKFQGSGDGGSNPSPVPGLYATLYSLVDGAGLVGRPIYGGYEGTANNALPFDVAHGLADPGATGGTLVATDVDNGAVLSWSADSLSGAYGDFTLDSGTGEWTYTPDAGAFEALGVGDSVVDSFVATVTDEHGATDSIEVDVTLNGINDAPVAEDDSFATDTITPVAANVLDDNGNGPDSDVDGDSLTVSLVDDVDNGTLVLNSDGSFTYTPDALFAGTDSFDYQVSDGHGGTDTATATIDVEAAAGPGMILVVDTDGSIIYSASTIQDAVDNLSADDQTILIGAGTYSGAGNYNVVVDRPVTIRGAGKDGGAGDTTVDVGNLGTGFSVDLASDTPAGTITFENLAVVNAQGNGIEAYDQEILGTLVVDGVRVEDSVNSGLFVGGRQLSGAYAQAGVQAVIVTDSDFIDNGQSSGNSANLFLYEFDGDATLAALTIANSVAGTNSAAYGIQISGVDGPLYDQIGPYAAAGQTYDVLAAMGNVTFEDVDVSGNYRKPGLYVQGYTDMTGLQFVSGNTVDVDSTSWGKPVVIDPMADQLPTGTPGTPGNAGSFFDDSAANGSYDLSGLVVTAPDSQFNELDGTTKADTIVGTNFHDLITGFEGDDDLSGGGDDDVIVGGPGADHMDGGDNDDVFIINSPAEHAAGETIDGGDVNDSIAFTSTTPGDALVLQSGVTNVETVYLGTYLGNGLFNTSGTNALDLDASAGDSALAFIFGNDGDNVIVGTDFGNTIFGHGGDDTVTGGGGDDFILGDSFAVDVGDNDTAVYADTLDASDFSFNAGTGEWTVTTDTEGTDTLKGIEKVVDGAGNVFLLVDGDPVGGFLTIQDAVDNSSAGDTIVVGATTVDLAGAGDSQVQISHDLNIVGAGKGVSIIVPVADTGSSGDARGMFLVDDGVNLDVSNLTVDGSGFLIYQAFRDLGSGTFDNVEFTEIKYNESTNYAGTAIAAFGPSSNINVTNSDFSEIGRIGVLYFGPGTTGTFQDNTYTGKGAGDFLDYALDISNGAVIDVVGNQISHNEGIAVSDGSTSAGILVTTYFGPGTTAHVMDNTFTDNSTGVFVGYDNTDTSIVDLMTGNVATGGTGVDVRGDADVTNGAFFDGTFHWIGGDGNNVIVAGDSNDIIIGGAGDDTMTGNLGSDLFVWRSAELNDGPPDHDTITDYTPGEDVIDLSGESVLFTDTSTPGQVTLIVSNDNDAITVVGANSLADITFKTTVEAVGLDA